MQARTAFARTSPGGRRKVAVTAALTLSAASIAGLSGTSRANGPLDSLAPVTAPLAPATAPVTQAAKPVTNAVATATQPVTQAAATA